MKNVLPPKAKNRFKLFQEPKRKDRMNSAMIEVKERKNILMYVICNNVLTNDGMFCVSIWCNGANEG